MDPKPTTANVASRPAQTPQAKPLSCTNCRTRKLKCSREYPCHHCVRSGAECVFPTRKRTRKPRKTKNSELLQRLNRLESIVGQVGLGDLALGGSRGGAQAAGTSGNAMLANLSAPGIMSGPPSLESHPGQTTTTAAAAAAPSETQQDDWQKEVPDSKASRYLSGEFWNSLCGEVEGLRQALEQSTDSDDEEQALQEATPESAANYNSPSSTSALSSGMLLGASSGITYEAIEHPPPEHISFLARTFFTNVDMILKILHRPTIEAALAALVDTPPELRPQLSPEREALLFAIYHAAVASLPASACLDYLNQRREDLARRYAAAVEQLLARADYLNSAHLEALQALTLYVACVRSTRGSRTSWALLALPIRLAQAQGLHRESGSAHLAPYEAELRRRLWWQLIVLDIRASEDRGTTTVVARGGYDTRLPLNVNDADFGPDSRGPLVERQGPTDVTFSLCTARCSGLFLHVEHAQGATGLQGDADPGAHGPAPRSVEETVRHAQSLEAQFIATADPSHAPSYLASVTVRLIILKLWLIMQYPLHPRRPAGSCAASRQQQASNNSSGGGGGMFPHSATLRTAISIVELNEYLRTGPYGERFRWWADTYVQWHPLAVALAELCAPRTAAGGGELVDRAWRIIDEGFPRWSEVIADTKSGTLWRPIRKLYKKAKAVRSGAGATTTTATTTTASTGASTGAATTADNIGGTGTDTAANTAANTTTTTPTAPTEMRTTITRDEELGTIYVRTEPVESRPPEAAPPPPPTTTEPQVTDEMDISTNFREPSVLPDLDQLSRSPYALTESMWGWRDLNYDIQFLDLGGANTMDWSTWDDFVNETQAEVQAESGSSEGGLL
ncbi:fungal-specific transcription factor domain-containing protein [Hypoxylon fuscum]|nr:fungal-specific transcription factor domain-containing protein [Hypoxylon fuscum]